MLKKILSTCMALAFVIISALTLSGCSNVKDFNTEKILSNGGMALIHEGYMYYIAGGTDDLADADAETIKSSSIYKRAVDESGNPIEDKDPELVYSGIAGFKNGGLFAFGEYLYFTTPSAKVTSEAKGMTDHTSFARVRMDGKKFKVLYTTETADDLTYAYYSKNSEELYIAILEGTELYSYDVLEKDVIEIASDVTSAVFSDAFGQSGEDYIFYTQVPTEDYLTQNGNMVYRTTVTGEDTKQISSGKDVTLLDYKYGYLYFSVDEKVYRSTTEAGLDKTDVVSYKTYDTCFFTANGGMVATSEETDNELIYVVWEDGSKITSKILATTKGYVPYFVDGDILYALNADKKLVRLTLDNGATETAKDTLVSDTVTVEIGAGLTPEKIGDYLYFYTETKTTDANGNEISTWNINSIKL